MQFGAAFRVSGAASGDLVACRRPPVVVIRAGNSVKQRLTLFILAVSIALATGAVVRADAGVTITLDPSGPVQQGIPIEAVLSLNLTAADAPYTFVSTVVDGADAQVTACEGGGFGSRGIGTVDETPEVRDITIAATCPQGGYTLKVALSNSGGTEVASANAAFTITAPPLVKLTIPGANDTATGLWGTTSRFYVGDLVEDEVFAYDRGSGADLTPASGESFSLAGHGDPKGFWSDGTTLWVANDARDIERLFAYTLATKARDADKDIDALGAAGNGTPGGIWSDGATLYVADSTDHIIYGYALPGGRETDATLSALTLSPGTLTPSFAADVTSYTAMVEHGVARVTLSAQANASSALLGYLDGSDMALADADTNTAGHQVDLTVGLTTVKIVVRDGGATQTYTVEVTRAVPSSTLSALTLSAGTLRPGFDAAIMSYRIAVQHGVTQVTVSPTKSAESATVEYLDSSNVVLDDADMNTAGHQVAAAVGLTRFKIKVTDGGATDTYTVVIERDSDQLWGWTPTRDIHVLKAAGNEKARGMAGIGSTLLVADQDDVKVYAYARASGARVMGSEFTLNQENAQPHGLWSDGTKLWSVDKTRRLVFVYMPDGTRVMAGEIPLAGANSNAKGIWSDGTTMWVADSGTDRIYAYALSDGTRQDGTGETTNREFNLHADNAKPWGVWQEGATLYVVDTQDHKIYAYNAPSEAAPADICDRTEAVRTAILATTEVTATDCASVTDAELAAITVLTVDDTSITAFKVGDFAGLTGLTRLELYNASLITELPPGLFAGLPALRILVIDGAPGLLTLPAAIVDDLTPLRTLKIIDTGLAELPPGVFDELTVLTILELDDNSLADLPAGIFDSLTGLTTLDLCNNDLPSLRQGVFDQLTNLTVLNLYLNPLTELPSGVFDRLTLLQELRLYSAELTELRPGVFDSLTQLTLLAMYKTHLDVLPPNLFQQLTNLEKLFLTPSLEGPTPQFLTYSPYQLHHLTSLMFLGTADSVSSYTRPSAPGAPEGLLAIFNSRTINLSWTASSGAISYQILRQVGSAAEEVYVEDTFYDGGSAAAYEDSDVTDGVTYSYRVKALNAGGASGASVAVSQAAVAAAVEVTLSLSADSVAEDSNTAVGVTARISAAQTTAFTVEVSAAPATDSAFTLSANTTLSFAANATASTGTVTITPVGNTMNELDKEISVSGTVAGVTGVEGPDDVNLTITDDDHPVVTHVLTLHQNDQARTVLDPANVPEDVGQVCVRVTATTEADLPPEQDDSPSVSTRQDSAEGPADFGHVSNLFPLAIADYTLQGGRYVGVREQCNLLAIVDDAVDEDNEQFTIFMGVTPLTPSVYVLEQTQSNRLRVTIIDDDDAPALSIADAGGAEGQTLEFTVTLAPASEREVTVDWAVNDGSATAPGDYKDGSGTLTFVKGDTSKTVSVVTEDDGDEEGEETFMVTLSNPGNATISVASATGTIPANDAPVVSSDATLSALSLSEGRLSPTFAGDTTTYTASVGYTVTQITVTPTKSDGGAMIAFLDGSDAALANADGNTNGHQVDLEVGENTFKLKVTAADDVTTETYAVTVTRTEEDTLLNPPASDPLAAVKSTAVYNVTFQGAWTTAITPDGLPGGTHFTQLVGAVHNADVSFLRDGETATLGVEGVAETGTTIGFGNEIDAAGTDKLSLLKSGSGAIGATSSAVLNNVTLNTDHPRITLITMVAPSPDWFVGVAGLSLLNADGDWVESLTVNLFPWDAGTEDGTGFSLNNAASSPRGTIESIRGTGKFTTEPIATLAFARQSVNTAPSFPGTETGQRSVAENTGVGEDIGDPVAATDTDALTYTLGVGGDNTSFAIVETSGQLQTKAALAYETKDSYTVTVTDTDTAGQTAEIEVTITVADVNETPQNAAPAFPASESGKRSVAENTGVGEDIGDPVAATDTDALTYTLGVGGDNTSFAIVETSG